MYADGLTPEGRVRTVFQCIARPCSISSPMCTAQQQKSTVTSVEFNRTRKSIATRRVSSDSLYYIIVISIIIIIIN